MKRFALVLLASILALALVACNGNEGEEESSAGVSDYMQASHEHKIYDGDLLLGTLTFEDDKGDTAIISDYVGIYDNHVVTIPEKVGAKGAERNVIAIGKEAFYYCTAITSVIIPEGITYIGDYAFAGCTGITSITIPASVTSIGKGAFNGCSSLTEIKFANGSQLNTIGDYAFNDCTALSSIVLPEGLTSIGKEAFRDCEALTAIKTPASLKSIGDMAFYGCIGLNAEGALDLSASISIDIYTEVNETTGEKVEIIAIGEYAFAGINKLYIVIPEDTTTAVYKYVSAMKDFDEADTSDESEEATAESSEETSSETVTESVEETSSEVTETATESESTEETSKNEEEPNA